MSLLLPSAQPDENRSATTALNNPKDFVLRVSGLWSLGIYCSFILGCLGAAFTFGALIRVVSNVGGVLGISV